jgi:hypothetical protein
MYFKWNVEGTWNLLTTLLNSIMWQLRRDIRYYVWAQASGVWFLLGKVVERILFRAWHCTRRVTPPVTHRTTFRVCAVLLPLCTPSCHGAWAPEKVYLTFTLCRNSTSMFARLVCFQNVWQWFNSTRSVVISTNVRRHLPSWRFEVISVSLDREHRLCSEQLSHEAEVCVTCRADFTGGGEGEVARLNTSSQKNKQKQNLNFHCTRPNLYTLRFQISLRDTTYRLIILQYTFRFLARVRIVFFVTSSIPALGTIEFRILQA